MAVGGRALAGLEASVCESAERAIELSQTEAFDLIFSDVVMPVKDGLQMLEALKPKSTATQVVMR